MGSGRSSRTTPRAVKVVKPTPLPDERSSLHRIEDIAFEAQVKRLTEKRKWHELELAFLLHGSTLDDRTEVESEA